MSLCCYKSPPHTHWQVTPLSTVLHILPSSLVFGCHAKLNVLCEPAELLYCFIFAIHNQIELLFISQYCVTKTLSFDELYIYCLQSNWWRTFVVSFTFFKQGSCLLCPLALILNPSIHFLQSPATVREGCYYGRLLLCKRGKDSLRASWFLDPWETGVAETLVTEIH